MNITLEQKNQMTRKGGFAPAQWVLGKLPRGVGHLLDEDEAGQLGVLHAQGDVATDFGLRARMRLTSQKSFVKQDCGRRFAAAVLRKAAPLTKEYHVGDLVCFQRKQGANEPGTEWVGVATVSYTHLTLPTTPYV